MSKRRNARACLLCGVIQNQRLFVDQGCPNCESLLNLRSNDELVAYCTSPVYEGTVAMMQTGDSWVAKWLRIDALAVGTYAVKVQGRLPEEVVEDLGRRGITYRPRDGSVQD